MTRRGGVLLEVLLALTLFVGGALAVLRATSQARRSVVEAGILQRAVDLATTRMAELEAGLISDADLREGAGAPRAEFGAFEAAPATNRLRVEVATRRSPYAGLTLVELDVLDPDQVAVDGGARIVFSLRKLVQLRGQPVDEYELDDMLEGLPERREEPGGDPR